MGRTDLADAEGIPSPWRSMELEDGATPVTSDDLCVKPGCCSTCEYPCGPVQKIIRHINCDNQLQICHIMEYYLLDWVSTLRLPFVVNALEQTEQAKGLSPV